MSDFFSKGGLLEPWNVTATLIIFGCIALVLVIGFVIMHKENKKADADLKSADEVELPPKPKPKPKPVIGYKVAIFQGIDYDRPFSGVQGTHYSAVDQMQRGTPGFHLYQEFEDAKDHPQPGTVYLEVIGYGEINVMGVGYMTSKQRVTQIIVDGCEVPGCSYSATGWVDGLSAWMCSAHGALAKRVAGGWLPFDALEKKLERMQGTRIAVRSLNGPKTKGLFKRYAQKDHIDIFVPLAELLEHTHQQETQDA